MKKLITTLLIGIPLLAASSMVQAHGNYNGGIRGSIGISIPLDNGGYLELGAGPSYYPQSYYYPAPYVSLDQVVMSAPAMHASMDTASTEMVTATTMGGAMVINITEARPAAITAKKATTIAGITNRRSLENLGSGKTCNIWGQSKISINIWGQSKISIIFTLTPNLRIFTLTPNLHLA